jgi:nucleotidyltransferase/DNA polymerase involved in DNA repair
MGLCAVMVCSGRGMGGEEEMSILYCAIPYFAAAMARRDDPHLQGYPLVFIGLEGRVFGMSAEAAACGVVVGMTARAAEVHCPEARLLDADVARCRDEFEVLLQLLEHSSPQVEPHGWGAAYVDLKDMVRQRRDAVTRCQQIGRTIRRELGQTLQPALGWDSTKFTAQAAARRTRPGHLVAVDTSKERAFLQPLPVTLLPLSMDALRRLGFLGLRTLGQYAALPPAAVGLQFGRAGQLAQRCARGEDDRPVIPRHRAPHWKVNCELDAPLVERERLLAVLKRAITPVLAEMRDGLKACAQLCLAVNFDDGSVQERSRTFLFPTADEAMVMRISGQLLDKMRWCTGAVALAVILGQIQDVAVEQLTLFPVENERERKLQEVQHYLAARFGGSRLRRVVLSKPGAPLPEWRINWLGGDE